MSTTLPTIHIKPQSDAFKGHSGHYRHCIFCNDWKPSGSFSTGIVASTGETAQACADCYGMNDQRQIHALINDRFDRLERLLGVSGKEMKLSGVPDSVRTPPPAEHSSMAAPKADAPKAEAPKADAKAATGKAD